MWLQHQETSFVSFFLLLLKPFQTFWPSSFLPSDLKLSWIAKLRLWTHGFHSVTQLAGVPTYNYAPPGSVERSVAGGATLPTRWLREDGDCVTLQSASKPSCFLSHSPRLKLGKHTSPSLYFIPAHRQRADESRILGAVGERLNLSFLIPLSVSSPPSLGWFKIVSQTSYLQIKI